MFVGVMTCLCLVLIGTAGSFASETLIVGPGGNYSSIQAAIDAAHTGDTILVYSGQYPGDLQIDKKITLKGKDTGSGKPVVSGSGNSDVITITANGVDLQGFEVRGSEKYASSIQIRSDDNVISGNTVTGSNEGIRMDHANGNRITHNTLTGNHGDGIYIHYSNNNIITDNLAENNEFGVHGETLQGNVISDNICKDNSQIDIYVENIADSIISGNRIESNELSSRSGGDGIGMRYGTNVTIKDNYVGKHYYGIKVYYSDTITVINNTVEDSGVNIRFDFGTKDSAIQNNTVSNGIDNILIGGEGSNNLVEYNLVSVGKDSIYLFGAGNNNTIRHNNVHDSTYGIRMYKSTGNVITLNYLHENVNDIYPDNNGNTVSDNENRANYYGEESVPVSTSSPTSSPSGINNTAIPTTTGPGASPVQTDLISWILGMIGNLFS
jgi:parallel beta-helix repeat protein